MRSPSNSQLLAMSFDSAASPWITLHGDPARQKGAAGWGLAWYPVDDNAAMVIKDPRAIRDTSITEQIGDWERFRSTVFVGHLSGAAKRLTQQDTNPFARSYAGRNFLLAHCGDLDGEYRHALALGPDPVFEPLGRTDSEHVFCWLLSRIRALGVRRLADVGWPTLLEMLSFLDSLGSVNLLLTDGIDIVAYRDAGGSSALHVQLLRPPYSERELGNPFVTVDLSDPLDHSRSVAILSTSPLSGGEWRELVPGEMVVVRRARVSWRGVARVAGSAGVALGDAPHPDEPPADELPPGEAPPGGVSPGDATHRSEVSVSREESAPDGSVAPADPQPLPSGLRGEVGSDSETFLSVVHETIYSYETPVEYSSHTLRIRPVHDVFQEVLDCEVELSPTGALYRYEDVFGNQSVDLEIREPYRELRVISRSTVRNRPRRELRWPDARPTIPLVWMPWQRQMVAPYLLPTELPQSQLRELSDYAMSFVERQDYDLVESLMDMSDTIYREYRYLAGSTTIETTPYDVYTTRRGVCQDFANLYICLARLLGVPARYRVGYVFTGADYENRIQSEASHAWAEVYIPHVGWRGVDPTNGCLVGVHHVRVAVGRNYRDATPTSGTIYRGGAGESLQVNVQVRLEGS